MGVKILRLSISILIALALSPLVTQTAYALPTGFVKTQVATNFTYPTAFATAPDGRIFITEKGGTIKIVHADHQHVAGTLPTQSNGERGLLGIALDPNFSSNNFMYVYYVHDSPLEIRVSRFTMSGDSLVLGSEQVLMRSTQTLGLLHHAGTVRFGPDGKLWITVGNNSINANSQDLSTIHGKLLRINPDGSVPPDNPFVGQSGKEPRIWSYGLRNPFRFNFGPSGAVYIGDVGENSYEEINIASKGGNFGWPNAEGPCSNCAYINPFYYYAHNGSSASVTGGLVYTSVTQNSVEKAYNGSFFYGDYSRGFIRRLSFDSAGNFLQDNDFDPQAGAVVDLQQGADGSIYLLTIVPGKLMKIAFTTENQPPVADFRIDPTAGLAPLTVKFDSTASFDPEEQPLTYSWNFGDGTTSTGPNPTHTYTANGNYTVQLIVSDGSLTASTLSSPIQVGKKLPTVTIDTPIENTRYNAGTSISYSGSATDENTGTTISGNNFSWDIVFHHGTHTHPFKNGVVGKTGTFTIPDENFEVSADTWLEIRLTVTTADGLSKTVSRDIHPNTAKMTFMTNPAGLQMTIDGQPIQSGTVIEGVVGFKRVIDAPAPQTVGSNNYDFSMWSDGGKKAHTITTPATDTTYTATYTFTGQGTGKIHFRVRKASNTELSYLNGATAKLTDASGTTILSTTTSHGENGDDGWVFFDDVPTATYNILVYERGYVGVWRQTTCEGAGTSDNVTVQSEYTENLVGVQQPAVKVLQDQIAYCKDVALEKAENGVLALRVFQMKPDPLSTVGWGTDQGINGVTVKLTSPDGNTVIQTQTSAPNSLGEDGWVFFVAPPGTYGLMGYKAGLEGFWTKTNCGYGQNANAQFQNQHTEGTVAAFNTSVTIEGGVNTYCADLGLRGKGSLQFRIREFDKNGNATGKFLNGVTAKLTDISGNTVYDTQTSKPVNGQDGWVFFNGAYAGNYGALSYDIGYTGYWKQTACAGGGTTNGATIKNGNTETQTAGWQNSLRINLNTVSYCADIGLKNDQVTTTEKGTIAYRVREVDGTGKFTGKFINGATAKLTDPSGNTVVKTTTSQTQNSEDGWVIFYDVDAGNYGALTYQSGLTGLWKQTDCSGTGTTNGASLQNSNTQGNVAVWQPTVTVVGNQIAYCKDAGLTSQPVAKGNIRLRVREFDGGANWTGNFVDGATAVLTDPAGNTIYQTASSNTVNTQAGWVFFDNVSPGSYAVVVYKTGMQGVWKQTTCAGAGTTTGATIQNSNTAGNVAAWNNTLSVQANTTTWCADLGLQDKSAKPVGQVYFRIKQYDSNGTFTGNYLNDVTVKAVDSTGTVVKTVASKAVKTEDGWAFLDGLPVGTYAIYVYKDLYQGYWKQTDCGNGGTTDGVAVTNQFTDNHSAAQQTDVTVTSGQITWCKDVGLNQPAVGPRPGSASTNQPTTVTPTSAPTQTPAVTPTPPASGQAPAVTNTPAPTSAVTPTPTVGTTPATSSVELPK